MRISKCSRESLYLWGERIPNWLLAGSGDADERYVRAAVDDGEWTTRCDQGYEAGTGQHFRVASAVVRWPSGSG